MLASRIALLCALLGFSFQFAAVQNRYGGNWTGLFCTGASYAVPPVLARENIHVFPGTGYDGQMYHYVAHDPLLRTNIARYMDNARVRYRRILLPAIAFTLALGNASRIDTAYIVANLAFLFLGSWWLGRYLAVLGLHPGWAIFFVLLPAALVALDRLTVDLAFTALGIGFALYARLGNQPRTFAVLVLACLCRDTGFLLVAGCCLALTADRRFTKAGVFALAALPAAAWYGFVTPRTPDYSSEAFAQLIPFLGIWDTLINPTSYPFGGLMGAALPWLDRLALSGFLLAVLFSFWIFRRNGPGKVEMAMLLFSCVGLFLPRSFWMDCSSGARVFTPLLLYVFLKGRPEARWLALAPLLMVAPRIG